MMFPVLLLIAAWAAPNAEGADPKKRPARHAAKANTRKPTNNYPIVLGDNPQYSKFERNHKWGLLDSGNKKVLMEPKYDNISAFDAIHNIVTVKLHGKWGCIEYPTGKIILPLKYDDIGSYGYELRKVKRNGKWGYVNIRTGEDVIPLKYDQIGPLFLRIPNPEYAERTVEFKKALGRYSQILFVNAKMPAVELNDQWGYIDRTGKEVIARKYQRASDFRDGVAVVVENYVPGLIDETGREVVPPGKYAEIRDSSEGLSVIGVKPPGDPGKNVFGYVDNKAGTVTVEPKYENAWGFRGGRALVMVEGKKFYVDKAGKELHLPRHRELSDFSEGRAAVSFFDAETTMLKWGYIDTTGKKVIAPRFDEAGPFNKGLANVKANGRSFYIDKAGKPVACAYCLTRVRLKGKWGYVDSTGKEILPIQYEELPVALSSRFNRFKLRGKYGLLDGAANMVAPPKYDELPEEAKYDAVRFKLNGKYGYMIAGNEIVPAKYDELPEVLLTLPFSRYKLNGKYGYLNGEGIEVTPAKYDEAPRELGGPFICYQENASGGETRTVRVSANGKYGYLSKINGKEIYPPVCEDGPLFLNKTRTKIKRDGKWGYIDLQGREVGSFEYEEDPCSIEKTKGDHYIFGPGADLKAQPHMASAGIAHLPAGSKIEVLGKTDKELTIKDVTDKWYEARYQDKRGYVWGGFIADAASPVSVKGKNGVVAIRNRTKHSDHCYHPQFEMQLVIGGNVVDSRRDGTLSNLTAKVISMKYESYEGFSTPVNLLMMTVDETHGQDQGSLSIVSGIYYYLDDGKLAEALHLKMAVEGEGRIVTSTVSMPDKGSKKDAVIVRTKVSLPNREDSFSETSYHWDWYKKSFRQF